MKIQESIKYEMNENEKLKANIANILLNMFNSSYKPHCFDVNHFEYSNADGSYYTLYIEKQGYTMVYIEDRGQRYIFNPFIGLNIPVGNKQSDDDQVYFYSDIIEYIVSVAKGFGFVNCTKETIYNNSAIIYLKKSIIYKNINMSMELNCKTKNMPLNFLYTYAGDNSSEKEMLKELGFEYFDRGMWIVEL